MSTKLCANLLNTGLKNYNIFSAPHNSMTKLCGALNKCEDKIKMEHCCRQNLRIGYM